MKTPGGQGVPLALLWLAVVASSLALRPLFPVDETRYLSVAWEMWVRHDLLLPWLNGEPYSHKPPLLFWLIHLAWSVAGVEAWPARSIAPLLSLSALLLVRRLGAALWPEGGPDVGVGAAWLTFASLFWLLFLPLVQFDLLVVNAALLAWLGLVAAPARPLPGWSLTGLAVGLGVLAKGPVILVFVLPPLLLGPLWLEPGGVRLPRWYAGGLFAVAFGAAIALGWAIPAAEAGGAAYRAAIFWGQSAGRVVDAFAHRAPWWSYVWMLPVLMLPWLGWPRLWRAAPPAPVGARRGDRFLWCVLVPAVAIFSAISGKQVKYALPLLPLLALWVARRITVAPAPVALSDRLFLAATPLAAAVLIPVLPRFSQHADWLAGVQPYWAAPLLVLALALGVRRIGDVRGALRALALGSALTVVILNLALAPAARTAFDLKPFSLRVAELQARGVPVAYLGHYQGQFHFLGGLRAPLTELADATAAGAWVAGHRDGYLVDYRRADAEPAPADLPSSPWRGGRLVLWPAARLAAGR